MPENSGSHDKEASASRWSKFSIRQVRVALGVTVAAAASVTALFIVSNHNQSHTETGNTTTTTSLPKPTTTSVTPDTFDFVVPKNMAYDCLVSPQLYTVQTGDNLYDIVAKHHTDQI